MNLPPTQSPTAPGFAARLTVDPARASAVADALAECLDPAEVAVSAFETTNDYWAVAIHFASEPDLLELRVLVASVAGDDAAASLTVEPIAARDWIAASLEGLPPVRAGRFVIHGGHDRGRLPPHGIAIEIEAALAFGTGHHATTRGCLLAIEGILKARRKNPTSASKPIHRKSWALDIGTGTGVLAIAAARALRGPVLASDIDPIAVRIAAANARANRAGAFVRTLHAAGLAAPHFHRHGPYGLVLANILLGPLKRLASPLARLTRPGTHVVLSGLLTVHANGALSAYRMQGLRLVRRIDIDEWTTLVLIR